MSIQAALIEIERFSKIFKAFEEAKNAIAELTSLEQNVVELTDKRNTLKDELDGKNLELIEVKKKIKRQEDVFLEKETAQTLKLAEQAKTRLELDGLDYQIQINKLSHEVKTLEEQKAESKLLNSNLQAQINDSRIQLDDLTSKIKTAETTIADIFKRTT